MMIAQSQRTPVPGARASASEPAGGELIALQAVVWPFATLGLAASLFWMSMPIGPFHLWAGLAVSLIVGRLCARGWRNWIAATLWLAAITLAGGAALGWLYDFSGDGQWYHLPAVLGLAEGWNPPKMPRLVDWNASFEREVGSAAIYVQHYAKGVWLVAAAVYRATGLLEAAKVFNLLYALAAYLIAARFLGHIGLSRVWAHALALAAALNPVVLYQMHSFFVDGQLAALCTLLVVVSLDYFHEPQPRKLLLLSACVVLLANAKFTGLVHSVSLGGGLAALAWLSGRPRAAMRYTAAGLASVAFAVVVVGYQPYVANYVTHGNPFFPVLDRDKAADVAMAGQFERWAPPEFVSMSRLEKLTRSLLAESGSGESMPQWKVPFSISKPELYMFFNTEPRYGGFGPWFGSVLIVTLVGYLLLAGRLLVGPVWIGAGSLALLMVVSALVNREAWWARLSPQIYLVPLILLAAMAMCASTWVRRIAGVLVILLLCNSALVAALSLGRAAEKSWMFRQRMAQLRAFSTSGPLQVTAHPSFRMITEHRLRSWSIVFERAATPPCSAPFAFSYPLSTQALACPIQSR